MSRLNRARSSNGTRRPQLAVGWQLALAMVGAAVAVVVFVLTFGWISGLEWRPGPDELPWDSIGRAAIPAAALVIAAGGVVLAVHGQRTRLEELQTARDANVTERYTKAVEQLGHENPSIRLGGLYALQRIANDSAADRDTIVQVISAHTRRALEEIAEAHGRAHTEATDTGSDIDLTGAWELERQWTVDLNNATRIVAGIRGGDDDQTPRLNLQGLRTDRLEMRTALELQGADLSRANLVHSTLENINLAGVTLRSAHLAFANLRFSAFDLAEMTASNLSGSVLSFGSLRGANLTGVSLMEATAHSTDFTDADLTTASLNNADLLGAVLVGAVLVRADLAGANLKGANLKAADLTGADLTNAVMDGVILDGATLTGAKGLPDGWRRDGES